MLAVVLLAVVLAATVLAMMVPGFFPYRAFVIRLRLHHGTLWNELGLRPWCSTGLCG
jgi:hypothetical protein